MMYYTIEVTPLILFILMFGVGAIFWLIYSCIEMLVAYFDWRRTHG